MADKTLFGQKSILYNKDEDKILIIKRSNYKNDGGKWDIVGGSVEFGEDSKISITRECLEETGIIIYNPQIIDLHSRIISNTEIFFIFALYLCDEFKIPQNGIKLSEEHSEYKWIKIDNINKYTLRDSVEHVKEIIITHIKNLTSERQKKNKTTDPNNTNLPDQLTPSTPMIQSTVSTPSDSFIPSNNTNTTGQRKQKIIKFLKEIDKLKSINRIIDLLHSNRSESVAEHSWHLAMMIITLKDELPRELNYSKMLEMALIHDLVEIYAGDTFTFDKKAQEDKKEREEKAANQLFKILPEDLEQEFHELFQEYETRKSEEARIVYSLDKLHPVMQNLLSNGKTWKENKITFKELDENKRPKMKYNTEIYKLYETLLDEAIERDLFYKK